MAGKKFGHVKHKSLDILPGVSSKTDTGHFMFWITWWSKLGRCWTNKSTNGTQNVPIAVIRRVLNKRCPRRDITQLTPHDFVDGFKNDTDIHGTIYGKASIGPS